MEITKQNISPADEKKKTQSNNFLKRRCVCKHASCFRARAGPPPLTLHRVSERSSAVKEEVPDNEQEKGSEKENAERGHEDADIVRPAASRFHPHDTNHVELCGLGY